MERDCPDERWSRSVPARMARGALIRGVFGSIVDSYARTEVVGLEHLARLERPVVFVANHCSHVDTPLLLRSLPPDWQRRTLVAAAVDYFYSRRALAVAVSLTFGTVPVERRGRTAGTDPNGLLGELLSEGWNLVMFPEGTRSRDGRMGVMRLGAARLAATRFVPIVPVHIDGTHDAMPPGRRWIVRPAATTRWARHALRVRFAPPIQVGPGDDILEAMERVRLFMSACGAQTRVHPDLVARRAASRAAAGAHGEPAVTTAGASATVDVRQPV
jgi:1-acyl-sn-glycerol-3-phosphate acyltransferase